MTRAKRARELRRQAAAPPPVRRKGEPRRASPKVVAGVALVSLIVAGSAVGIALAFGGNKNTSSSVPTHGTLTNALPGAADAHRLLARIPQHGNTLGSPGAPVTMVEYIDLQCPHCAYFETTVMPTLVQRFVRTGKLKVVARPIAVIGPDSLRGRDAAIAAGLQNKLFNFTQVNYANQGVENTGWLDDAFVQKAAASVPGMNVPRLVSATGSSKVAALAKTFAAQADADNVPGTPAVYVGPSNGRLQYVANYSAPVLSAHIRRALR
jgi:protein-disulfide isomerase